MKKLILFFMIVSKLLKQLFCLAFPLLFCSSLFFQTSPPNHSQIKNNNYTNHIDHASGHQFRETSFFANSKITAEFASKNGTIWIGADSISGDSDVGQNGLFSLQTDSKTWVKSFDTFGLGSVLSITYSNNDIYFGGEVDAHGKGDEYGLILKHEGQISFQKVDAFKSQNVRYVYNDNQNNLFVLTGSQIYCKRNQSTAWNTISDTGSQSNQTIEIVESKLGTYYLIAGYMLWTTTKKDNWKWTEKTFGRSDLQINHVCISTIDNVVFLGTFSNGLFSINQQNNKTLDPYSQFVGKQINMIFFDNSANGNLWIASSVIDNKAGKPTIQNSTLTELVNQNNNYKQKYFEYQEFWAGSIITTHIIVDKDHNYWAATSKNGVWVGYWKTTSGYYIEYKPGTGCVFDPQDIYDEIFSTNFQLFIKDKGVKDYKINGKLFKYNYAKQDKPINFNANKNGPIINNQDINLVIEYTSTITQSVKKKFFIKTNYTDIGNKTISDVATIFKVNIGDPQIGHVRYRWIKKSALIRFAAVLAYPNYLQYPYATLIVLNLSAFRTDYRGSSYQQLSFTKNGIPNGSDLNSFDGFAGQDPQFIGSKAGIIYDFNLIDLVGNKSEFILQLGGSQINQNFKFYSDKKSWLIGTPKGIIVIIVIILIILGILNAAYLIYHRKKTSKRLTLSNLAKGLK